MCDCILVSLRNSKVKHTVPMETHTLAWNRHFYGLGVISILFKFILNQSVP